MLNATSTQLPEAVERVQRAWNTHDIAALTASLHPEYESLHPLHPERNVRGREKAIASWAALFEALPDFQAELLHHAVGQDAVWTEWRWSGTHMQGAPFNAGGVIVFGLTPEGDRIAWARLYTETLQIVGPDWEAVLDDILSRQAAE